MTSQGYAFTVGLTDCSWTDNAPKAASDRDTNATPHPLSAKGRLPDSRVETVELIGLYWHFVDVVWIVIFTVVYLVPGVK